MDEAGGATNYKGVAWNLKAESVRELATGVGRSRFSQNGRKQTGGNKGRREAYRSSTTDI
jgi:hypothetical protein